RAREAAHAFALASNAEQLAVLERARGGPDRRGLGLATLAGAPRAELPVDAVPGEEFAGLAGNAPDLIGGSTPGRLGQSGLSVVRSAGQPGPVVDAPGNLDVIQPAGRAAR